MYHGKWNKSSVESICEFSHILEFKNWPWEDLEYWPKNTYEWTNVVFEAICTGFWEVFACWSGKCFLPMIHYRVKLCKWELADENNNKKTANYSLKKKKVFRKKIMICLEIGLVESSQAIHKCVHGFSHTVHHLLLILAEVCTSE